MAKAARREDSGVVRLVSEKPKRAPRAPKRLSVVDQVRHAFRPANRLAAMIGAVFGGAIPVSIYLVAHQEAYSFTATYASAIEMYQAQAKWLLVLGGLLFSAKTVFQWGRAGFQDGWKALGFVVILEGVMTTSSNYWLSIAVLVLLTAINGIAAGVVLSGKEVES